MKRTLTTLIVGSILIAGIALSAVASATETDVQLLDPNEIVESQDSVNVVVDCFDPQKGHMVPCDEGGIDEGVVEDPCDTLTPEQLEHAIDVGRCPEP